MVFHAELLYSIVVSFLCHYNESNRSAGMAKQALERSYLSSYWDKVRQNERSIGGYVSTILPDFISRGAKDGRSFN